MCACIYIQTRHLCSPVAAVGQHLDRALRCCCLNAVKQLHPQRSVRVTVQHQHRHVQLTPHRPARKHNISQVRKQGRQTARGRRAILTHNGTSRHLLAVSLPPAQVNLECPAAPTTQPHGVSALAKAPTSKLDPVGLQTAATCMCVRRAGGYKETCGSSRRGKKHTVQQESD